MQDIAELIADGKKKLVSVGGGGGGGAKPAAGGAGAAPAGGAKEAKKEEKKAEEEEDAGGAGGLFGVSGKRAHAPSCSSARERPPPFLPPLCSLRAPTTPPHRLLSSLQGDDDDW